MSFTKGAQLPQHAVPEHAVEAGKSVVTRCVDTMIGLRQVTHVLIPVVFGWP